MVMHIAVFVCLILSGVSYPYVKAMTVVAKAEDFAVQRPSVSSLYAAMVHRFFDSILGPVNTEEAERLKREKAKREAHIKRNRAYREMQMRIAFVERLLAQKRDEEAIEEIGKPGLRSLASRALLNHIVYKGGHIPVLQKALDLGVNEDDADWISEALWVAAEKGYWDTCFFLYDVLRNHKGYQEEDTYIRKDLMSVLFQAAYTGNMPLMRKFLPDPHVCECWWKNENNLAVSSSTPTVLHAAIEGDKIVMVNFLLKRGALLGFTTGFTIYGDLTEIQTAKRLGFMRIAEVLACFQEELDLIAQESMEKEVFDASPFTPESKKSILRLIRELPGDESKRSIINDRLMVCSALASTSVIDAAGNTILHRTAAIADKKLFRRILYLNSELIAVKNKQGETPLEIAVVMGGRGMLEIFGKEIIH